jgi:hypothetical protein
MEVVETADAKLAFPSHTMYLENVSETKATLPLTTDSRDKVLEKKSV